MQLSEVLAALEGLPESDRAQVIAEAAEATKDMLWVPNPGPQTDAYFSEADELFYGGQAGGGKSALICGLAVTAHERSLILRRMRADAEELADTELIGKIFDGNSDGWNASKLVYRDDKLVIRFGGCELERDKQRYKGKPSDLVVFDEITDFLESQYVFITIWNRSTTPGQRCRVVCTGNPPTNAEGLWVTRRWAAWLDPKHPNPAKPGELRWYVTDEKGDEVEVNGRGPHMIGGKETYAKSRTFIPAKLSDNPDLAADGEYERILDALPKELRDAYRDGRFDTSLKDGDFQVIPTAWVQAAQARWKADGFKEYAMTAIGFDPAGGGKDKAELAYRHGGWYGELVTAEGKDTADGSAMAATIVKHRRDGCPVVVDLGGGYGGAVTLRLKDNEVPYVGFNGAGKSTAKTLDGKLSFVNKRAEAWWKFREELDPDQEGGSVIALPPDAELLADLTAPTWQLTARGIQIEDKNDIRKRLGRSPGKGDAVVMCLSEGNKAAARRVSRNTTPPKVVMGHSASRRIR